MFLLNNFELASKEGESTYIYYTTYLQHVENDEQEFMTEGETFLCPKTLI